MENRERGFHLIELNSYQFFPTAVGRLDSIVEWHIVSISEERLKA